MTDMKRTYTDDGDGPSMAPSDRDEYPYGLQLSLQQEELDKLGVSELPAVGKYVNITARASVSAVCEEKKQDGSVERCLQLQIEDMTLGAEGAGAAGMYPGMK